MPEPVSRAKLPGAAELFRTTAKPSKQKKVAEAPVADQPPAATGRVKHDEKITVYFSSEELLALEAARLLLRRNHRLAVDRGRIVRAAVALALADLDANGAESALYQHLDA